MKTFKKKNNRLSNEHTALICQTSQELLDPEYSLYNEEYFKELLCTERKRTERSKKPFLLLRLNIEKIFYGVNSKEVLNDMLSVLFLSTRETDLYGWYRRYAEIGIIFTEIDAHDNRTAMEAIVMKIQSNLLRNLPLSLVQRIEMHFHLFPEEHDTQMSVELVDSTFYPDMAEKDFSEKISGIAKRIMDVIGSVVALLLFSPFFLIIPVLIKLTSEGPVFFRQERIGQSGRKFVFLKYRTMYVNNDDSIHREYIRKLIAGEIRSDEAQNHGNNSLVYKLQDDPRVTPVGGFLRKTSLDEIPQFVNVLKGEMSLVGPRPAIPYEFESYDMWHKHRMLQVKPGITGLWQVKGRSSTTFDDMVRLDLKYIRERSLWLDVKLLLLTPWAVLKGKGAY